LTFLLDEVVGEAAEGEAEEATEGEEGDDERLSRLLIGGRWGREGLSWCLGVN
jgi:hypothetical protein